MITFTFLDKKEKDIWLPRLFDLFYENMCQIAPSGLLYEQEKREWLDNVSPAMDKPPRQIILCLEEEIPVGYVQYYTRENLLMIEEVQIQKQYQCTTLFYGMCFFLAKALPDEIKVIEAYADQRNLRSQGLMVKLGMKPIGEEGCFVHLQGTTERLRCYRKRG